MKPCHDISSAFIGEGIFLMDGSRPLWLHPGSAFSIDGGIRTVES